MRPARLQDVPALERLIPLSVRGLQSGVYSPEQMEAALGPVFAVDRQLICDGTYYVVERDGEVVGAGGWSRRRATFGGAATGDRDDSLLDPDREPARIRAFFVHPRHARQGIGRALLLECEKAVLAAGFREAVLVATLVGAPLYASMGYEVIRREEIPLADVVLPVVRMGRLLGTGSPF